MSTHREHETVRSEIMDAIQKGKVQMRPRWHFILFSAFGIIGSLIVFLSLLYVVSLLVFFLRESGAWFAPSFGLRGWFALLHHLPLFLVLLLVSFVVLLEILVRRYRFVYRKPILISIAAIFLVIVAGGFAIAQTGFHRQMFMNARHGYLPPGVGIWYGDTFRAPRGREMYHGKIAEITKDGFVLVDIEGEGTSTIIITPRTRLPYGADFSTGDFVVVMGDEVATDTVQAFGIREIGE